MPNAVLDSVVTPPGVAVTINVLANDIGNGLTIISLTSPVAGDVVVNPDQSLTYTPEPDFEGEDSFTYVIRDSSQSTSQGEVRVAVGEANRSPMPMADTATVIAGAFVDIDVLANDNDPDGDVLFIAAISMPGHGVVQMQPNNKIRYVPQSGFVGSDSFSYGVGDGNGAVATTVVALEVLADNQIPIVTEDTISTFIGIPVSFEPLANDNDPNDDALQISSLTLPVYGQLVLNADQSIIYTPSEGFVGEDTFSYTASDGRGGTASAMVTVLVKQPNDFPIANDNQVSVEGDSSTIIDLLGDDFDPNGDPLFLTSLTLPLRGTLAFNPDQTLIYSPDGGYVGLDSFTYVISDGRGGTDSGQVNITVTDPPAPLTFTNSYRYRRLLVIPPQTSQAGTSLNFVMRVDQSGDWLRSETFGGKVLNDNGLDIRFELNDGTKLAHEVESYDPSAGRLTAWVRIPAWQIDAAAKLSLYYGSPTVAAAESDPAATWIDYLAVWDARTGNDRTGNGRNLTMSGVGQGALLGDAGDYNSTSRGTIADSAWLDGHSALTVQTWLNALPPMIGTDRGFLSQGNITGNDSVQGFELRHDAAGFFGGASNVILWQVNTSSGWTRIESAKNAQVTGPMHVVGTWQDNVLPTLYLQGKESPSSNAPDLRTGVTAMTAGPLTFGAAAKDDGGAGWQGLIDEVRIRSSVASSDEVRLDHASQSAPELFYGIGDEEHPTDAQNSVVALPFTTETLSGIWVDISLSTLIDSPAGGPQPTVTNLASPANGIVSIINGAIRYTPNGGYLGVDDFTFTVTAGDKTSTGHIRINVMGVSPGQSGWDWSYEPPQLPADRSKVKTWMIGQENLASIDLAPDNVLLGVLPDQIYTDTVTWKTPEIPCPFVLIGGDMRPTGGVEAQQYNRTLNGLNMLFRWRMAKNATYMGGRPFFMISHLYVDWNENDVIWGDFMRGGMQRTSNFANMPEMYWQNIYFNGGCIFFNNDESLNPGVDKNQPHSDIFQGSDADVGIGKIGRCRLEWRGQGIFTSPGDGSGTYHIGQNWSIRDSVFYPRARPSYHPTTRLIQWIKPFKTGKFDYGAGLYPSFSFDRAYFVIDPEQPDPLTYFAPRSSIGGSVTHNSSTGRYGFPMQGGGPNPSPVYSGEAYAVDRGNEPTFLTKDEVGLSFQVRDVDSLYEAFGQ